MDIIKLDGFQNIKYVSQFPKEWDSLFKNNKSTNEEASKWLDRNLRILDEDPVFFTKNHKSFEPVKSSKPQIYSIHERSKNNPRVLYYLLTNKNEVVLLTPFLEKNKSDYYIAAARAEKRAKQLQGGNNYGKFS